MFASPSFRLSIKLYVGQNKDFDITSVFVKSLFSPVHYVFTVLSIHLLFWRYAHIVKTGSLWLKAYWLVRFDVLFIHQKKFNTK